ncbi:hypothetical protein [Bauldia sp.]|uniref:hypothetical protein n=1 Tax=Bauldia sp. TaxID=2575872 RepID=UPI003BAADB3E
MRRPFRFLALAVFVGPSALPVHAEEDGPNLFFFVDQAQMATMADGELVLEGMDAHLLAVPDRPMREAHVISVEDFLDQWSQGSDSFAHVPPNAVISGVWEDVPSALVVELTTPEVEGTGLRFRYEVLEGEPVRELREVTLVIDARPCPPEICNPQVTDVR